MEKGKFISFEGIDGAGKSAQMEAVALFLKEKNIAFVTTREPGGTFLGEQLRNIVLKQNESFLPQTHALLMYAARLELLNKIILPALNQGKWVLSDRFLDATFAYQGGGEKLGIEKISVLNQWVLGDFQPDLTFFFHVDIQLAQQRIENNRAKKDHFEKEQADFFQRVQETYLSLAKANPTRLKIICGNADFQIVRNNVFEMLNHFLKENGK